VNGAAVLEDAGNLQWDCHHRAAHAATV